MKYFIKSTQWFSLNLSESNITPPPPPGHAFTLLENEAKIKNSNNNKPLTSVQSGNVLNQSWGNVVHKYEQSNYEKKF